MTADEKFDEEPDCPNMEEFMVKMMKVEEYL